MKHVIWPFLLLVIAGCTSPPTQDGASEKSALPVTCRGAIEAIANSLDNQSVETLKKTKKEDLIMFHHTWGMGIRNAYGLWTEDSQIRKSCAARVGEEDIHPDAASGIIMEGVWGLVNDNM